MTFDMSGMRECAKPAFACHSMDWLNHPHGCDRLCRAKAFQAIPLRLHWQSSPWISDSNLLKCVARASEVARCARENQILEVIGTPVSVWDDVIVLCPHGLKSGMLLNLFTAPNDSLRVGLMNKLARRTPNNGHTAEPAVIAIALMELSLFSRVWHPLLDAKLLCKS